MIRLMSNSDTDTDSDPMQLLDPRAPGYEQRRDQAYIAEEMNDPVYDGILLDTRAGHSAWNDSPEEPADVAQVDAW